MKLKQFLSILIPLTLCICQTATAQLFKEELVLLNKGLTNGKIVNADFNNDGFMDILLAGENSLHKPQIFFLKNVDGISFDSISSPFIKTTRTAICAMDYDNNGLIDVIITGIDTLDKPIAKLYLNQGTFYFEPATASFQPLREGAVNSFDADNDGKKDLIFSGISEDEIYRIAIYQNSTDGAQQKIVTMSALISGKIVPMDFDRDGLIDVFINGIDSLQEKKSLLYKNHGDFNFTEEFEFDGIAYGDASPGDFNTDGKTDLLLTGEDIHKKLTTFLYLNDKSQFVTLTDTLPALTSSDARIVDLDHNGKPEIFLAGLGKDSLHHLYIFKGDTLHLELLDSIEVLNNSTVALVDINNDGNLDIIETGRKDSVNVVRYIKNQTSHANSGPSRPGRPIVIPMKDKAFFLWTPALDDATPSAALTYDLYIDKSEAREGVKSPESDRMTGFRKVVSHGAQGQSNGYLLTGLTDGKYYWGIQAIDNAYKGDPSTDTGEGGFCEGGGGNGFELCFVINSIDTTVCKNSILKIKSPFNNPSFLFSARRGYLGEHLEYDYVATDDDELYVVSINYQKCSESLNYVIKIAPSSKFGLGNDMLVCKDDVITVVVGAQWKEVKWYVDNNFRSTAKDFVIQIPQLTRVKAEVWDDLGCRNNDEIIIDVYKSPFAITRDYTINLGESAELTASGVSTYNWDVPHSPNETASLSVNPRSNSVYHINGTDLNGCPFADSVKVKVKGELFIPNLFSPNGDGANETFKVYAANVKELKLQVYNRNGILIFEGEGHEVLEKGWDGKKNNVLQAPGVYIWTIKGKYIDGRPIVYEEKQQGIVRLIR